MKKVLIVDDSAFMRKILNDIIVSFEEYEVVGAAKNGQEALDLIPKLKPDVIILDIEMPVMDGISALKVIVAQYDIPVIMFSSLTIEGAEQTMLALEIGAFDFLTKPTNIFKVDTANVRDSLKETIESAVQSKRSIKSITRFSAPKPTTRASTPVQTQASTRSTGQTVPGRSAMRGGKKIIGIGTSTGGPKALWRVIPNIPKSIAAPILVVQHMPKGFIKPMAERLDGISNIRVKEAENGEILQNGVCYIAPGGEHMRVVEQGASLVIKLSQDDPVSGHRPSADAMFMSLLGLKNYSVVAVIMTGMGSDGTNGLVELHNAGATVIAQDEMSSVVFGMPKAAINAGSVDIVVTLDDIAKEICKNVEV